MLTLTGDGGRVNLRGNITGAFDIIKQGASEFFLLQEGVHGAGRSRSQPAKSTRTR